MNTLLSRTTTSLLIIGALIVTGWAMANPILKNVVEIGRFSHMDIQAWDEKSFKGNTQYSFHRTPHNFVLQAQAQASASALFKRIKIDLQTTPYLNWSWLIQSGLPALNEQSKDGDDYAARVYVVIKTGLAPWNARALNYVWSSDTSPPETWPNAFTEKAIMIPLRTKKDAIGAWKMEKVNVQEDIKKYLDIDAKHINGVALMTDTDNSENFAVAYYGDIYFSAN